MRIDEHPILGTDPGRPEIRFTVDGEEIRARQGDTIAAALLAAGKRVCRDTRRTGEPRGIFCGIGQCTDCLMEVDGTPNVRTCVTRVREGMVVARQIGWGSGEVPDEPDRD